MSSSIDPVKKDFVISQGVTWKKEIQVDTDYLTLIGKDIEFQIKNINDQFEDITLTSINGDILCDATLGLLTIIISAEETDLITKTGSYKLEFLESGSITVVERPIYGSIKPLLDPTI
jgi:hypothetical protein